MYGNNPVSAIRIQLVDANNYRVHERILNNNGGSDYGYVGIILLYNN